jgi:hypothetical protein
MINTQWTLFAYLPYTNVKMKYFSNNSLFKSRPIIQKFGKRISIHWICENDVDNLGKDIIPGLSLKVNQQLAYKKGSKRV